MEFRSAALNDESDRTMSRGQASLRRIARGDYTSDRMFTPVSADKIGPKKGSVFPHRVSPVRDFRFQNLTVDEAGPAL